MITVIRAAEPGQSWNILIAKVFALAFCALENASASVYVIKVFCDKRAKAHAHKIVIDRSNSITFGIRNSETNEWKE